MHLKNYQKKWCETVRKDMVVKGFDVSLKQVTNKLGHLKDKFMRYSTQKNKSGNSPPRPILFKDKCAILFGGPAANPSYILGSSLFSSGMSQGANGSVSQGANASGSVSQGASSSVSQGASFSRAWSSEIFSGGMAEHSASFPRAKETTPSKRKAPSDEENTPKSKNMKKEKEAKLLELQEKKMEMMSNALDLISKTSEAMVKTSERMNDLLEKFLERQ